MTGASALAATMHSGVVTVTGYASSSNIPDVVPTPPFAIVQLQVSQDGTTFIPIAAVSVNANGTYKLGPISYPARYVRAAVVSIDARITAIAISAFVGSAT